MNEHNGGGRCSRAALLKTGVAAGSLGAAIAMAGWPERARAASNDRQPVEMGMNVINGAANDALLAANLGLAFRLGAELSRHGATDNLFFSPLSIEVALAMAYNGASGSTRAAMSSTLGLKHTALADVNRGYRALLAGLAGRDAAVKLSIADAIWLKRELVIVPGFAAALKTYYGAGARSLDFADAGTPAVINAWVKRQTHGLIPSIVKTIDPATVMYLINALYLKAAWASQFPAYATKPGQFTTGDGQQKTLPMMSVSSNFRYARSGAMQAIRLPYASGKFSVYIVLPPDGVTPHHYLGTLTPASWNGLLNSLQSGHGAIRMPRFTVDYAAGLRPALSALGMAQAFDPNQAMFSAMIEKRNAYITDVQHRAIVKVDEHGTLAAAVTSIGIGATAIQADSFTMDVNRPFFCAIRDDVSGSLLFLGAIVNPG